MKFIEISRNVLLIVYFGFLAYAAFRYISGAVRDHSLRGRMAFGGLCLGIASGASFAYFYVYLWAAGRVPFHGYRLWLLMLLGLGIALIGVVLGTLGNGLVRLASIFVSAVAALQWYRELTSGEHAPALIDITTVVLLLTFFVASFATSNARKKPARRSP